MDSIRSTGSGLRLTDQAGREIEVAWTDIAGVTAYAIDTIGDRLTYLDVVLTNGSLVSLNDRMAGWTAVIDTIAAHLHLPVHECRAALDALTPDGAARTFRPSGGRVTCGEEKG